MTKSFEVDPEARALFRQQVGDVKPVPYDRVELRPPQPAPMPRFTRADEEQVLKDMISDYFEPAELDTGDEVHYCVAGLQHSVLRQLRRGQFRVGGTLDLHGMTIATAREALSEFLRWSQREHRSCVKIIHGKGKGSRHKGPVLKQKVVHWLRQRAEVLAFCSARPMDGGTGAVYVLLRRRA